MKRFLLFIIFVCLPIGIVFASEKIDINTATLEQLDELTGIGPKYAQAIIDARPFSNINELVEVKGIGEKTLEKIKGQGLACVACTQSGEEVRPPEPPLSGGETSVSSLGEVGPPKAYPSGVFINEIMPSPEGPDADNEWIVPTIHLKGSAYL